MNQYEKSLLLAKSLKPTIKKIKLNFIDSQEVTPVEFYLKTKGDQEIKAYSLDCSNFEYDSADRLYIQLFNNGGNLTLKTNVINHGTFQDKNFEMFAKLGSFKTEEGEYEVLTKSTKSFSSSLSKMKKMQKSIVWQKQFEKAFYEIAEKFSGVDDKNRKHAPKVQLNVLTLKRIRKDRQCYAAAGIIQAPWGRLFAVVGIGETIFIEPLEKPVFKSKDKDKNQSNRPILTCYADLDNYFDEDSEEDLNEELELELELDLDLDTDTIDEIVKSEPEPKPEEITNFEYGTDKFANNDEIAKPSNEEFANFEVKKANIEKPDDEDKGIFSGFEIPSIYVIKGDKLEHVFNGTQYTFQQLAKGEDNYTFISVSKNQEKLHKMLNSGELILEY